MLTLFALKLPLAANAGDPVTVGASVTFIASSDGYPAPTFQWRKNGSPIAGATNATYSIGSVATGDAATYTVVATNEAGSAVSPDEVLVVNTVPTTPTNPTTPTTPTTTAPSFTTQPTSTQTVAAGGSVSLSVAVSGSPTPTIQWQKNSTPISGATNTTLTLTSITALDAGIYLAVASNSAGTVSSNTAEIIVVDAAATIAPKFITQPAPSLTGPIGGTVTFTVSASGTPAPTYQWKKNGTALAGATSASLTLSALTLNDSATYVAVATNSVASVTSDPAVLTVIDATTAAPIITIQPTASQTVLAGSPASISVAATGSPLYQWRKNGANIAGATTATLSFAAASSADAATYSVLVSNNGGAVVSSNSLLMVQSSPTITTQPASQAVLAGAPAKFSVGIYALPGATLQWQKNGVAIAGATSSVLLLNSVTAADVGTYSVVAKNPLGTTTSNDAALVIATPPVITAQPSSQTVNQKSNVAFSVSASGSPAPSFQWKKNGIAIAGATSSTLTIKAVNKPDSGDYSVEVRNVVGWVVSSKAALAVNVQNTRAPNDGEDLISNTASDPASGLVNLSVRANAGSANNGLIVGFVINGPADKPVLVRGVGPTLGDFGVTGVLRDPQLALYSGSVIAASNDDWSSSDNATQVAGISARLGAFALPDRAADSALMATLANGAYTVQLSGKDASGVALVEVYDAGNSASGKLVNLSVRTYVGTGNDAPNVGFVIAGPTARRVMLRAVGPTLSLFGLTDAISDPQLELYRGNVRIDQNDNWGGGATLSTTFTQVGAFGLSDGTSKDAVLITTLEPGAYTVVVSGVNNAKGVGLVEVYDLQ